MSLTQKLRPNTNGPNHDGKLGETDPVTLARRQKQIDYGKNTESYKIYLDCFPK